MYVYGKPRIVLGGGKIQDDTYSDIVTANAIELALLKGRRSETTEAMDAFQEFYRNYMEQFFDLVYYFYDANRHVDSSPSLLLLAGRGTRPS